MLARARTAWRKPACIVPWLALQSAFHATQGGRLTTAVQSASVRLIGWDVCVCKFDSVANSFTHLRTALLIFAAVHVRTRVMQANMVHNSKCEKIMAGNRSKNCVRHKCWGGIPAGLTGNGVNPRTVQNDVRARDRVPKHHLLRERMVQPLQHAVH